MGQMEKIKDLQGKGLGPVAIAERLQLDRKTVSKYMAVEAFEKKEPPARVELPSKLDPFKPLIREWLEEDRKNPYKQRHTAKRIHDRLTQEHPGYDGNGEKATYKYLCVTFPYSNAGYMQLFGGETAECVTHGLQDIFRRIGGVPSRLVFDNASGVGRRVSEHVRMAELFLRFKAHHGFEVTFCNPYAGYEKGNVGATCKVER